MAVVALAVAAAEAATVRGIGHHRRVTVAAAMQAAARADLPEVEAATTTHRPGLGTLMEGKDITGQVCEKTQAILNPE